MLHRWLHSPWQRIACGICLEIPWPAMTRDVCCRVRRRVLGTLGREAEQYVPSEIPAILRAATEHPWPSACRS